MASQRRAPGGWRRLSAAVVALIATTSVIGLAAEASAAGGTILWARRYGGPAHRDDVAYAIAASPDGTKVFVTGDSFGAASQDYATAAFDAETGATLWARRYDGPVNGTDLAVDIAPSPDGSSVFVTGYSEAKADAGWATIGYDASTGATLWIRRHRGGATAVTVSPDGSKVFVVGSPPDAAGYLDYATLAYDAQTGATVWARRYDGPAGLLDRASAVFATRDTVFVTGSGYGSDATWGDYGTVAYDATNGTRRWVRRYDGPAHGYDIANAVTGSADGSRVFVTGSSENRTRTSRVFATVAYGGSTGERLWTRRYGTGAPGSVDATADGSAVFVTGTIVLGSSGDDFATIGYDGATGAELWVRGYSSPDINQDNAESIVVNPSGTKIYVTGRTYRGSTTGVDIATFAYGAATGSTLWSRFYSSAGEQTDNGASVDVSPDGSAVFVGG